MKRISGAVPGVSRLAGLQVELSRQAKQRLKWFDYYNLRGLDAGSTAPAYISSPIANSTGRVVRRNGTVEANRR